jgi:hypothetical protein
MHYPKYIILFTLFLISLATPSTDAAQAQEEYWEICINKVATLEGANEMLAKVYVIICDPRTGMPMQDPDVQSVKVELNGHISPGELKDPDVPISVTLAGDKSRSMAGAAPAVIKALKQSLNYAPGNSLFSLVLFDDEIQLLQDFTENISVLTYAIDQYQVSQKGTCLYDAAYATVEAMAKAPPGRRAVILFTDGKDETKEGKKCSKHTFNELVAFAIKSQVPISTIGLSYRGGTDAMNIPELKILADSTGGISAIAREDNLVSTFKNIMMALKAQRMIEVPIYPRRGVNNAVLNITLKDGTTFTTEFPVTSNTEYQGPVRANLAGFVLRPERQSYEVQLDLTAPELVGYIRMEILDREAGSKVWGDVFYQFSIHTSLFIPTEPLTIGREYTLCILAIRNEDNLPFNIDVDADKNPSPKLCHDFVFDPSGVYPSLELQSVAQPDGDLILTVEVTSTDLIGGFDVWLENENTNTQVPNSRFTAPAFLGSTGTITIPTKANRVKDGTYTVVVRVLDKNEMAYPTAEYKYEEIGYNAPSLFVRLIEALLTAPIYLFSILGIILAAIVFLMFNPSRQSPSSGMPILEKLLRGKLGSRKSWTAVIPEEDDEPIRSRIHSSVNPSTNAAALTNNSRSPQSCSATVISAIPQAMITVLQDINHTLPQRPTVVASLPFLIGRSEGAILISDSSISHKHAQITYDNIEHAYYITDMNSSNGTRLNNQRLIPGQPIRLSSGAVIGLGPHVTFRFDLK